MHAYTNFTVKLTAAGSDIKKFSAFLAKKLDGQAFFEYFDDAKIEAEHPSDDPQTVSFVIEECYACVWQEDLEALAIKLARLAPDVSFSMDGVIDASQSAGEYMDFKMVYSSGKLTVRSSDWYLQDENQFFLDAYPDYEAFSEEFMDFRDKLPLYTREEYETFRSWDFVFYVGDNYRTILSEIPLEFVEEIDTADYADEA